MNTTIAKKNLIIVLDSMVGWVGKPNKNGQIETIN